MKPRRTLKQRLRRASLLLIAIYALSLAALVAMESSSVYPAFPGPSDPVKAGLTQYSRQELTADDLPTISYWESTAKPGAPTLLYFHGNGGGLHLHTQAMAYFAKKGFHTVAIEYPGYPDAAGKPSEQVIIRQAQALYDATRAKTGKAPIIWGFSLGSGIATQLAASRDTRSLILEAPYTAVVDRAAELFPLAPVHYLMRNTYRSRDYIAKINAPIFIMHGDADRIIPITHGRDLFSLAHAPKTFRDYRGFGHLNLIESTAYDDAVAFIRSH